MLKALQFALDLFSDMRLYDHVVTSYVAICFYELIWNYKNLKIRLFTKILYYENLEPYSIQSICLTPGRVTRETTLLAIK